MFRNLKGRRVIVSTSAAESFRGTVLSAGLFHLRLGAFEVIDTAMGGGPAEGVARIPRRIITWIQEL